MRPPYGECSDQLHAAGVVEEALEHEVLLGRHDAEHRPPDREVVDDHRGRDLARCPVVSISHAPGAVGIAGGEELVDVAAQLGHLGRQLGGARRRLAHPERHGRVASPASRHPHHPGLDPADLPRVRAEQEDVAGHRLDGPVLVDRADERVVRLGDDPVVAGLGDRAARGERGEAAALAAAQLAVDRVVVHVRAARARGRSRRRRRPSVDDLVELRPGQVVVRRGLAHELVQVVGPPLPRRGLGDHVLRRDVERQPGRHDRVEPAGAHRGEQRRALDQLVAGQRVEAALRRADAGVVRAADPLQEGGDAAGRADLAHELDRPDVDAELERRGGDERLQLAGPQPALDPVPAVLRQAAVVRGDHVVAEPLAELVREPLGEPAGVDEHERGAVLAHELGDPVEHVVHLLGRGRPPRARRRAARAARSRSRWWPASTIAGSGRSPTSSRADGLDRALGRRQPDPGRPVRRTAPRAARG